MKEKEDFVDIMDREKVPLNPVEVREIQKNPARLTKEGCQKKVELWKQSNNKFVQRKFKLMLKHCKTFVESGTVKVKKAEAKTGKEIEEEKIIFSRDDKGKPKWIGTFDE